MDMNREINSYSFVSDFTLPSGLIRALGGWLSDKYGARNVNWAVFWTCLICLFLVSYPQTTYIVHGMSGDHQFAIGTNVWVFTFLIFVIGIAQGIGKASVYRIIHDYYPNNMGSVGGMVGVIGGLGGFTMPILFGVASDLLDVRSSCFMLMFGVVAICMISMNVSIRNLRKAEGKELEGYIA